MAYNFSPKIVTEGLTMCLDGANVRSYPSTGTTWSDLSKIGVPIIFGITPIFTNTNGGELFSFGANAAWNTGVTVSNFMTISCWFKTDTQQTNRYLVAFGRNLISLNGFDLRVNPTTVDGFTSVTGTNSGDNSFSTIYYDNIWHNIASTYNGSQAVLYYDGNPVSTRIGMSGNLNIESTKRLNIFSFVNNGFGFRGSIAQVLVYSRALSAAEISQNYTTIKSRFGR